MGALQAVLSETASAAAEAGRTYFEPLRWPKLGALKLGRLLRGFLGVDSRKRIETALEALRQRQIEIVSELITINRTNSAQFAEIRQRLASLEERLEKVRLAEAIRESHEVTEKVRRVIIGGLPAFQEFRHLVRDFSGMPHASWWTTPMGQRDAIGYEQSESTFRRISLFGHLAEDSEIIPLLEEIRGRLHDLEGQFPTPEARRSGFEEGWVAEVVKESSESPWTALQSSSYLWRPLLTRFHPRRVSRSVELGHLRRENLPVIIRLLRIDVERILSFLEENRK